MRERIRVPGGSASKGSASNWSARPPRGTASGPTPSREQLADTPAAGQGPHLDIAKIPLFPDAQGRPLDAAVRGPFERSFGQDFSGVRVHTGPSAGAAAGALGARAFASGGDVAFGPGRYAPDTLSGRFLLAHELAHVAQQRLPSPDPHTQGTDRAAEAEADRAAVRAAFDLGPTPVRHSASPGAVLASPLSDQLDQLWTSTSDKGRIFDVLRARGPITDPDVDPLLARIFNGRPDDLWLARTIVQHGPEPLWPTAAFDERRRLQREHGWAEERGQIHGVLMTTAQNRPVDAYFFPGTSDERALVIAGVHGSEQGGIEVAEMLIQTLKNSSTRPYYSVIVVPTLFPDNAARRLREGTTQTNRNFPAPGRSLTEASTSGTATDAQGHAILQENIALMRLIERFRPSRIASIHGSFDREAAGIFSDPHTVSSGARTRAGSPAAVTALETAAAARTQADRELALAMARDMARRGAGAGVRGNRLGGTPTTGWSGGTPGGTSLGGWAPQDITEGRPTDRPSMTLITVEVATNTRSTDLQDPKARTARRVELEAYRDVVQDIFLGPPRTP